MATRRPLALLDSRLIGELPDADQIPAANVPGSTVGKALLAATNPGALTFVRINADNSATFRSASDYRSDLGLVIGTNVQAYDATLAALAAYNANGIVAQTAADTFTGRTITGTANEITVANGNGVSGNPTLSLPAAMTFTGKTVTGGTFNADALSCTSSAVLASASGSVLCGSSADNSTAVIAKGGGKAVRLGANSTRAVVEGVDSTGSGSFQPLYIGGSTTSIGTSGSTYLTVSSAGAGATGAVTATTTVEAGKSLLVTDVYQLTAVTTSGQTRTLDAANGDVQTISANDDFTLNVTGPAGKSCRIKLYVYNANAGAAIEPIRGTGWATLLGHLPLQSTTTIFEIEWSGSHAWFRGAEDSNTTGDKRPT